MEWDLIYLIRDMHSLRFYKHFHSLWNGFYLIWTHFCQFFIMVPDLNNSTTNLLHRRTVFFWSLRLIIAHIFPIGFMSEEFPGHSSTVNPLSSKNVRIFCKVWHGVRSCWKMPSPLGKSLCIVGSKWVCRTVLQTQFCRTANINKPTCTFSIKTTPKHLS